ncbi:hypothetical protein PL321_14355 [Caloramator sp. mosi_1]|uniref:hypothetical protein n=1 Tax=Caloramator sp. mosi_1 TaxID=3023090 RepID=UPI00235FA2F4|nr:hypothetical protein [Caloramator sp. mosi_1]WDC83724.1 hypothetical protein PL321_14355 [Caloramator sp. mosi_1]
MLVCSQSVTFLVPPEQPTAVYTINFDGVKVENGNSIWCYSVSVAGNPGLSNWILGAFEACEELLEEKLISVTRNGVELIKDVEYEIGNFLGFFGIKFDVGVEKEESPVLYCITLEGIYKSTEVDVAAKGGPTPAQVKEKAICGPSCEVVPKTLPIGDLIESIALQEAGLAHIINAEGEKIQKVLELNNVKTEDIIEVNKSVSKVLSRVIELEVVLESKLEDINKLICGEC